MPGRGQVGKPSGKYGPHRPLTEGEREIVLGHVMIAHKEAWRIARVLARCRVRYEGLTAMARQYYDELIDAAFVGLCVAAQRYDPSLGYAFGTFGYPYVRAAVGRASREAGLAVGPWRTNYSGRRAVGMLSDQEQDEGHIREGEEFGIWDPRNEAPEEDAWLTPEFLCLLSLALPAREWGFVEAIVFGGLNLRQVARAEGLTHQRVHQIYNRALRRLRDDAGFMRALTAQMARRRAAPNAADFRGTRTATAIA